MKELSQEYKDIVEKCHIKEKELMEKLEALRATPEDLEAVKAFSEISGFDKSVKRSAYQGLTEIQKQAWEIGFDYGNTVQKRTVHEFGEYCNAIVGCTEKYVQMIVGKTVSAWCENHKPLAKQGLEA